MQLDRVAPVIRKPPDLPNLQLSELSQMACRIVAVINALLIYNILF